MTKKRVKKTLRIPSAVRGLLQARIRMYIAGMKERGHKGRRYCWERVRRFLITVR